MKPKKSEPPQATGATNPPTGGLPCQCGSHSLPPAALHPVPDMLRVPDRSGFSTYVSEAGYVVIVDEQGGLDRAVSIAIHPDHLPALARWLRQVAQPAVRRQLLVAVWAHEQKAAESATP